MKILDWLSDKFYNIVIRYVKMRAKVEVVSPFHPSRVTVYLDIFGKYSYEVEHYRLPLTKDLRVDIGGLLELTPVQEISITYPDKWVERKLTVLFQEGLITEEDLEGSEYFDEVVGAGSNIK